MFISCTTEILLENSFTSMHVPDTGHSGPGTQGHKSIKHLNQRIL